MRSARTLLALLCAVVLSVAIAPSAQAQAPTTCAPFEFVGLHGLFAGPGTGQADRTINDTYETIQGLTRARHSGEVVRSTFNYPGTSLADLALAAAGRPRL